MSPLLLDGGKNEIISIPDGCTLSIIFTISLRDKLANQKFWGENRQMIWNWKKEFGVKTHRADEGGDQQ